MSRTGTNGVISDTDVGSLLRAVYSAACEARAAGISFLPIANDGTKKTTLRTWKEFQERQPTEAELRRWFGGHKGFAFVCGSVSGGLELFEFDDRATYEKFKEAAVALGYADLVERIEAGHLVETPGGGVHWYYYCDEVRGNTKLAERPVPDDPNKRDVLIETRGEGGYGITAPSGGPVHPSGKPYRLLRGGPKTIATISGEERDLLWGLAKTFDEMPPPSSSGRVGPSKTKGERAHDGTISPGDDYAARTAWSDILPAGWTHVYTHGETELWRRPDKGQGWSASINHGGGDSLFVFSTSTSFKPQTYYSKFAAYALLNHGGDFSAAAKALYQSGYGTYLTWVQDGWNWRLESRQNPVPKGTRIAKPGDPPPGHHAVSQPLNPEHPTFPLMEPGRLVKALDRGNFGFVVADHGVTASVRFEGEAGTATVTLPKSQLQLIVADGQPAGKDLLFGEMSDTDLGIVRAKDVAIKPIEWLWKNRLARGAMALMAGDGGIGKSQLLLAIGARVSTAGPWFDGDGNAPLGTVVILSAEDRADDTIVPRLLAMEADLDKIVFLTAKVTVQRDGKEPLISFMSFQDLDYWREVFRRFPDANLLIVDPLPSYLGRGVNDSKNSEIRAVLEPFLTEIVEPNKLCMLCNTHLNKSTDAKTPVGRIVGSIAYANLPRNVHLVVRDPEDPTRRFFAQAKCNNAPDGLPSMAFRVERREIEGVAGEMIETAVPIFESDPVVINLQEMVNGKPKGKGDDDAGGRRGPSPAKSVAVAEWLWERLQGGPVAMIDLIEDARGEGLLPAPSEAVPKPSISPLYNARDRIPTLHPGYSIEQIDAARGFGLKTLKHWRIDRLEPVTTTTEECVADDRPY